MDDIAEIPMKILEVVLFVVASVIFLPALFIVNTLQEYWSKKVGELLGF